MGLVSSAFASSSATERKCIEFYVTTTGTETKSFSISVTTPASSGQVLKIMGERLVEREAKEKEARAQNRKEEADQLQKEITALKSVMEAMLHHLNTFGSLLENLHSTLGIPMLQRSDLGGLCTSEITVIANCVECKKVVCTDCQVQYVISPDRSELQF